MDFTTNKATFFYGSDSTNWKSIGTTLPMTYTLGMFEGYRFALFDYATKTAGGTADFDWFKIGATVNDAIDIYQTTSIESRVRNSGSTRSLTFARRIVRDGNALTVGYDLDREGTVEILLVDAKGAVLDRVVSARQTRGFHQVRLSGTRLDGHGLLLGKVDKGAFDVLSTALVE